MNELFTPYGLCGTLLENRVVLAHMTRTRTLEKIQMNLSLSTSRSKRLPV